MKQFSLATRAMIVALRQERWNNSTVGDEETTQQVLSAKKAEHDAGRFAKVLVPPRGLRSITSAYNEMRRVFREHTLTWGLGQGILKSENWTAFQTRMLELKQTCEAAADEFAFKIYPTYAEPKAAKARMGALYDPEDFPSPKEVRAKYDVRIIVLPVPDQNDFRVALADDAVAAIREGIEEHVANQLKEAHKDLWNRVLEVLAHFAEIMKDPTAKFKDVTVTDLAQIAQDAEALALTPDPKLTEVCKDLAAMGKTLPAVLRTDAKARKQAAKDAAAAVARIEQIMKGAF